MQSGEKKCFGMYVHFINVGKLLLTNVIHTQNGVLEVTTMCTRACSSMNCSLAAFSLNIKNIYTHQQTFWCIVSLQARFCFGVTDEGEERRQNLYSCSLIL